MERMSKALYCIAECEVAKSESNRFSIKAIKLGIWYSQWNNLKGCSSMGWMLDTVCSLLGPYKGTRSRRLWSVSSRDS